MCITGLRLGSRFDVLGEDSKGEKDQVFQQIKTIEEPVTKNGQLR